MPKTLRTPGHTALMKSLTDIRKRQGFTQQELADALGRPQSFVAKIETGERRIDAVELVEWSLALRVDAQELLKPVEVALRSEIT